MEEHGTQVERKRFGQYLRTIREERKLSLDTVEEMSTGFPERVTKSHLSRIENGQAIPTFPRMFTLSQIYGVPVSSLAEKFEVVLIRGMAPPELAAKSEEVLLKEAKALRVSGQFKEALQIYEGLVERMPKPLADEESEGQLVDLRLQRINCLVQLTRYASAKDQCENLLNSTKLSVEQRVITWHYFTMCCYRLGKFTIAMTALERAKEEMQGLSASHDLHAHFAGLEGNVRMVTGAPTEAAAAYRKAMTEFDQRNNSFEACRYRLNLSAALIDNGRAAEARVHLQKAAQESKKKGYDRHRALALSSLALLAYRDKDYAAAESHCLQSNYIARPRDYYSIVFRNCYYLWRIAQHRNDDPAIRANARTLRAYLSRVGEFLPEADEYRRHLTGGNR